MDSFYGVPRQPPKPPTINPIERIPVVPEVSVIDNGFIPQPRTFNSCGYNMTMRPQVRNNFHKDSFDYNSTMSKKHVRFKNPCPEPIFQKENLPQTLKTAPDLKGKTFKQIYMANMPDRHLDLSIFEPPRQEMKKSSDDELNFKLNETVKEKSLNTVCNEVPKLKSIENINPPKGSEYKFFRENFMKDLYSKENISSGRSEVCTQTDPPIESKNCTEIANSTNEPTIKDLFKIIQQQNEQIMLLQRQVQNLKTTIRQPEIEDVPPSNSPTKKGLFSFDVKATSFEFSFRPQHNKFRKNEFLEPKIQEIIECDNMTDNQNNSLHLDESLDVKDSYVSNVPSIAIEMDEYKSSDDDEDPEIGLSFYKDLMNQVNNALKKAQKQSECQQNVKGQSMKAVKQATLQHLKNIGVNLSPIQESNEVTGDSVENDDVSCAVQQLLMKYLPSEKLAKVVNKPKEPPKIQERKLKPTNTEFSFATLQYMRKYNLIDNNCDKKVQQAAPKILDVTALKLQPKLL